MTLHPFKSLEVLVDWLQHRLCRHFVWTLKYPPKKSSGVEYLDVTTRVQSELSQIPGVVWRVRHTPLQGGEIVVTGGIAGLERLEDEAEGECQREGEREETAEVEWVGEAGLGDGECTPLTPKEWRQVHVQLEGEAAWARERGAGKRDRDSATRGG